MSAITGRVAKKIRVLVVDSSRIHTQLLSDALRRDSHLHVIDWDWDPASLVPFIQTHQVDVLAISFALNDQDSRALELMRELQQVRPETRVVVLLDSQNDEDVINAFRAGARGIFGTESSAEMFCKCIHRVYAGEIWADTREVALAVGALAAAPVVRAARADGMSLLSKREVEVVRCVVQGLTNQEIAAHMGLSRHTIKNYLFRIFDKLGVSSRVELLFMTLNQTGREEKFSLIPQHAGADRFPLTPCDEATLTMFEEAAERGIPAAQLALAQAYLERQTGPDDLICAYMWYLIATERTWQGRIHFTKMLTARQLDEAHKKAAVRLARMKQSPASTRDSIASARDSAETETIPLSRAM
jgi:two-component system, NarL family, nitrate/nitrite response regulator NarL